MREWPPTLKKVAVVFKPNTFPVAPPLCYAQMGLIYQSNVETSADQSVEIILRRFTCDL